VKARSRRKREEKKSAWPAGKRLSRTNYWRKPHRGRRLIEARDIERGNLRPLNLSEKDADAAIGGAARSRCRKKTIYCSRISEEKKNRLFILRRLRRTIPVTDGGGRKGNHVLPRKRRAVVSLRKVSEQLLPGVGRIPPKVAQVEKKRAADCGLVGKRVPTTLLGGRSGLLNFPAKQRTWSPRINNVDVETDRKLTAPC